MKEIFHRVSVRKFEDRPVEDDKVEQVLRAAMAAPSAGNQQPWDFYVVTSKEKLQALAQISPYAGCAAHAPMAIVTAYHEDGCRFPQYAQIDLAIAMENLWLAAQSLGLGGVWLGVAPEEDRMVMVEKILSFEPGQRAFAIFPMGYPAEEKDQQDRFKVERIHYVK
ncbi:MAG: nitroreductase family protein [Desulfovibrionaceae bacterium]|nr:nitroreductase family protein [Desulfovibrionaceae bacterium]